MNEEQKQGPGRPRKYASDAERKRAYRQRKKERLAQIQKTVEKLEQKVKKITTIQSNTDNLDMLFKELEAPRARFTPSEIAEMETEQLLELRDILRSWLEGYKGLGGIVAQLSTAIIPQTYFSFLDLGLLESSVEEEITDIKYIPSVVETQSDITKKGISSYFKTSLYRFSSSTLTELFEQIVLLYLVEAEIASRRRDKIETIAITQLERRIKELEEQINFHENTEADFMSKQKNKDKGETNEQ
ncbi:MAG: hypothetical protein ACTSPI_10225 [Candidatus Heimdallarchaeaceae archaeon]